VKYTRSTAHRRECEQLQLSTVENTHYARVFHSRQWSNYDVYN